MSTGATESHRRAGAPTLVAGPESQPGGFGTSLGASDLEPTRLELGPVDVADLILSWPLGCGANLVALTPREGETWSLAVKRGSETLGAFEVDAEVGMATAVRLAVAVGFDPVDLFGPQRRDAARRIAVATESDEAELLVAFDASPLGVAVEVRPITINGLAAGSSGRRKSVRCCSTCGTVRPPSESRCDLDGGTVVEIVERPEPGGFIGGYRLGSELGEGGMGIVIAGEHAFLGRQVAIKLLHRTIDQDPFAGRRFLAEARAASSTRHPNIVDLLDYGLLDDGRPYIVMERLDGESLQDRLDRSTAIDPEEALLLAREIALALGAAHGGGVVHLDLKPSNVILLDESAPNTPRLKLIDFGAAARAGSTLARELVGTPAYMSPEHARGDTVDARSDLYSLGVVLFEMISGELPFPDDDPIGVLKAHLLDEPPSLSGLLESLPRSVSNLVSRMLQKNPSERHQNAHELVADIESALLSLRRKEWLRWLP